MFRWTGLFLWPVITTWLSPIRGIYWWSHSTFVSTIEVVRRWSKTSSWISAVSFATAWAKSRVVIIHLLIQLLYVQACWVNTRCSNLHHNLTADAVFSCKVHAHGDLGPCVVTTPIYSWLGSFTIGCQTWKIRLPKLITVSRPLTLI